jgi:hypothetical protein
MRLKNALLVNAAARFFLGATQVTSAQPQGMFLSDKHG